MESILEMENIREAYREVKANKGAPGIDGIRRHIRKAFWLRWHCPAGRKAALKRLGVRGRSLGLDYSSAGAWRMARHAVMHTALSLRQLRKYRLDVPWDFAASQ